MGRKNTDEKLLEHMPATRRGLIEITGMPTKTAFNVIKRLHEGDRIHVIGWERTPGGGAFIQIWQAGPGVDAYCQLQPYTQSQIWARHKKKIRKSGELEDKLAAKRARYHADKAASSKTKATWFSALGVAA
jgi:hypothetical protein